MSIREQQFDQYKKLKKIIKNILNEIKDTYTVWFQSRLKSEESINEKLLVRNQQLNDIIGFRLIYPWTSDLYILADILCKHKELDIIETKTSEEHKVIHMYGKTQSGDIYEIQLWPTIIYTCFEYEHDKIYKPKTTPTTKQLENSLSVRQHEHTLQNIVDVNRLVPYDL